jgi:hypothetical protein
MIHDLAAFGKTQNPISSDPLQISDEMGLTASVWGGVLKLSKQQKPPPNGVQY